MDNLQPNAPPDFRKLFLSSSVPRVILTPGLQIVAATDGFLKVTMTTREGIEGRGLFEIFPENPSDPLSNAVLNLKSALEEVARSRAPTAMPVQKHDIRMPGSEEFEERYWNPVTYPIFDHEGRVELFDLQVEDVTNLMKLRKAETERLAAHEVLGSQIAERKIAEDERDRFFSLSLDMLCIANAEGYFKRVSPAFTQVLGWSVEELLARPYVEFVHPDDLDATSQVAEGQVVRGHDVMHFENRYRHRDGTWRTLSWRSVAQPDGLMYATARDVTEQREAAESLRRAKAEADTANVAKSEFLSHMSHELRTPLNAVIGFAQLLQLQSIDSSTLESAKSILNAGKHLLTLVDEVLDLAKIEAGKLTISLEPVAVDRAIAQAVDLVRPIAEEHGVTIHVDPGVCSELFVAADRLRLVQVLVNLLTNSTNYNHRGGTIDVRCIDLLNGTHRIEVSDSGVGIDSEAQKKLFIPFERGKNQSESGTGLGLALSRRLMILMGGRLSLVQSDPSGSTFAVDLDSSSPPASTLTVHPSPSRPQANEGLKVVYIEDNLSNLHLMEKVFEHLQGMKLIPAIQASAGLQLIDEHKPDLVLLDLHLPDAHGIDVLRKLKGKPDTARIPVVILSADATDHQIKRLLDAGAQSFLTKPLDLELLFDELNAIRPKE